MNHLNLTESHRAHVLSRVSKLWSRHPTLSFCELIDQHIIVIGTMADHTTDDEVIARTEKPK